MVLQMHLNSDTCIPSAATHNRQLAAVPFLFYYNNTYYFSHAVTGYLNSLNNAVTISLKRTYGVMSSSAFPKPIHTY